MPQDPTQVDVVVIGLGPGGEEVAGKLAEAGLSVVGVDERLVGGECPYWGCVPSKMMIRAADLIAEARRLEGIGGVASVTPDWAPVAKRIRDEATDSWDDQVAVDRLVGKGATFVRGHGVITARGEVTVGDQVFVASKGIVLATGTKSSTPPIPGLTDTPFWTNHEAIETEEVPASLAIIGGGAIGLELAQVFTRFGSKVTVIEVGPRILGLEDPEASELLTEVLRSEGVTVLPESKIQGVSFADGEFAVDLEANGVLRADKLLVAAGRRVELAGSGVTHYDIDESARALPVDERLRAADGLWGVGDVAGKGAFTHVAMYHAAIVIADILGKDRAPASYHALPRVTFTDPEIGAVGLTEKQAREQGLNIRTSSSPIPASSRGWIHKAGNEGFIKLIEDADRGVLVGATSAGPNGGEVLGALAVAVHAAVPTDTLRSMIYAYPTFHRAIEDAVNRLA